MKVIPCLNNQDRIDNGVKPTDKPENRHHILPSSRIEKYSENEIVTLFMNLHAGYHRVFGNAIMQEAIAQLLKINGPVLSDKYKKDVEEIINMSNDYIFKDGIYIKR